MASPAEEAVARVALARGYLTRAQVDQALARSAASGEALLPLLRPGLGPAQLAELAAIYQAAQVPPGGAATLLVGAATSAPYASGGELATMAAPGPGEARGAGEAPTPGAPQGRPDRARGSDGAAPAEPGARVGPYVIERELARGGMGVVSIARHVEVDRRVALKQLLKGGAAAGLERARFLREAEALARLTHPGVVRVYEVGQADDGLFMAMELVEGTSLAGKLQQGGPLDPREAARLCEQVARALEAAHALGILHRDLKPANVLLDLAGTPRVTDFGLARDAQDERDRLTKTGQLLGTPNYMPPEQASGDKHAIDARADVYSLGATLYALLTGRPPFEGATVINVVTQVLTEEPPRPTSLRAGLAPELEAIVLKCLEKPPDARYPSAAALADDLARYLAGEPTAARPPTRRALVARWARRHRAHLAIGGGGGLLAAVALAVALLREERLAAPTRDTAPPVVTLATELELAPDGAVVVRGELSEEGCAVTLAGRPVAVDGRAFAARVEGALAHGAALEARDAAGNAASAPLALAVLEPGHHLPRAVEALPAGATLVLRPGLHLASWRISQPLRLVGAPGAELRAAEDGAPALTISLPSSAATEATPPLLDAPALELRDLRVTAASSATAPVVWVLGGVVRAERCAFLGGQSQHAVLAGLRAFRPGLGVERRRDSPELDAFTHPAAARLTDARAVLVLRECRFELLDSSGLRLTGRSWARLERCTLGTAPAGSDSVSSAGAGLLGRVARNSYPVTRDGAVHLEDEATLEAEDTTVERATSQGFTLWNRSAATLVGCTVADAIDEALLVTDSARLTFRAGKVLRASQGLYAEQAPEVALVDSELLGDLAGGHGYGVLVRAAGGTFLAQGCLVSGNRGLRVEGAIAFRVERCRVTGSVFGLQAHGAQAVSIVGSRFEDNERHGLVVASGSAVTLRDVTITGNGGAAIYLAEPAPGEVILEGTNTLEPNREGVERRGQAPR